VNLVADLCRLVLLYLLMYLIKYCSASTNILCRKSIRNAGHKVLEIHLLGIEEAQIDISFCGKCAKCKDFWQYICSSVLLK